MNNSDKIGREINDSLASLEDNDVECMNTNTLEDSTSLGKVDNVIYQSVTVSAAPRPVTENGGSVDDTDKTTSTRKQAEEMGKTGENEVIVNMETTKNSVRELLDDGRSTEPDVGAIIIKPFTRNSEDTFGEKRVCHSEVPEEQKIGMTFETKENVEKTTEENLEELDNIRNKDSKVVGNDYPELSELGIKIEVLEDLDEKINERDDDVGETYKDTEESDETSEEIKQEYDTELATETTIEEEIAVTQNWRDILGEGELMNMIHRKQNRERKCRICDKIVETSVIMICKNAIIMCKICLDVKVIQENKAEEETRRFRS